MKSSLAIQIKDKAAMVYAAGIIGFSVVIGIVVTILVIVNHNS
jgi:hypothetical protein